MRALAVIACLAGLAAACGSSDAPAGPSPAPAPAPARIPPAMVSNPGPLVPSRSGRHELFFIGDSLTQGSAFMLPRLLAGWDMSIDAVGGRPLGVGMDILDHRSLPADGRVILAIGLFTNNPPTMLPKLEAAVEESLRRVGPNGCVVWATIARPPVHGHTYARVNTYLRGMAVLHRQTMRLVEWERWVAAHRRLMNPKYPVHPKVRGGLIGWKVRARMFAAAIRSC